MITWIEAVPTARHRVVTTAASMGLGNQQTLLSLMDRMLGGHHDADAHATEADQIDMDIGGGLTAELQQPILGVVDRPIGH